MDNHEHPDQETGNLDQLCELLASAVQEIIQQEFEAVLAQAPEAFLRKVTGRPLLSAGDETSARKLARSIILRNIALPADPHLERTQEIMKRWMLNSMSSTTKRVLQLMLERRLGGNRDPVTARDIAIGGDISLRHAEREFGRAVDEQIYGGSRKVLPKYWHFARQGNGWVLMHEEDPENVAVNHLHHLHHLWRENEHAGRVLALLMENYLSSGKELMLREVAEQTGLTEEESWALMRTIQNASLEPTTKYGGLFGGRMRLSPSPLAIGGNRSSGWYFCEDRECLLSKVPKHPPEERLLYEDEWERKR